MATVSVKPMDFSLQSRFLSGERSFSFQPFINPSCLKYSHFKRVVRVVNREKDSRDRLGNRENWGNGNLISKSNDSSMKKRIFREYKLSDFEVSPYVSIGLSGRSDELIFEAIVKSPTDSLKGTRVVLRKLLSRNAYKWGKRAMEISSRIAPRGNHPYTAQLYGYITSEENGHSLTLVHGFYGSYSLHNWLHCPNWLPVLENQLALNAEGGPNVQRHFRVMKMVLRDVLIGVNYVHSRGMAKLDLRPQNLHVCSADRHIKVGIFGAATDLFSYQNQNLSVRKNMTAFDIRRVGLLMVHVLFKEFLSKNTHAKLVKFLKQGHSTLSLREFFRPIVCNQSNMDSVGMRVLDLNGGAGWHLLALMLTNNVEERISCKDALKHPFLCGDKFRSQFEVPFSRWCVGSTIIKIVEGYVYLKYQRRRIAHLINALEKMSMLSPFKFSEWYEHLNGNWRLIYSTGRQTGLTFRQANPAIQIDAVNQTFFVSKDPKVATASLKTEVSFRAMPLENWPDDKSGISGSVSTSSSKIQIRIGTRYRGWSSSLDDIDDNLDSEIHTTDLSTLDLNDRNEESNSGAGSSAPHGIHDLEEEKERNEQGKGKESSAYSWPSLFLEHGDIDIAMTLDYRGVDTTFPERALTEVRRQIPHEMFDISQQLCITYVDGRLLIIRTSSCTMVFLRSPKS